MCATRPYVRYASLDQRGLLAVEPKNMYWYITAVTGVRFCQYVPHWSFAAGCRQFSSLHMALWQWFDLIYPCRQSTVCRHVVRSARPINKSWIRSVRSLFLSSSPVLAPTPVQKKRTLPKYPGQRSACIPRTFERKASRVIINEALLFWKNHHRWIRLESTPGFSFIQSIEFSQHSWRARDKYVHKFTVNVLRLKSKK